MSARNALMKAGMTIFLGWFVGGRASAILLVSNRGTRAYVTEREHRLDFDPLAVGQVHADVRCSRHTLWVSCVLVQAGHNAP